MIIIEEINTIKRIRICYGRSIPATSIDEQDCRTLAGQGKYLLGANNNESLELILRHTERFGLRRYYQGVKRGGEWLLITSG